MIPVTALEKDATSKPSNVNDQVVKPAWVWGEANLPEGFPPPGPVGQIVVKHYPAYRAAWARSGDNQSTNRAQNNLFRPLFNHIQRNDIAMTAPVEMTYEQSNATNADSDAQTASTASPRMTAMAFMYAKPDMGTPGQDGSDGKVEVLDMPAMTVLSIGVRGNYNDEHFQNARTQLDAYLSTHPSRYEVVGQPRYLGYNSPFVPWFLRYGEVQLPVRITP